MKLMHSHETPSCCSHDVQNAGQKPWYRNNTFLLALVLAAAYFLSFRFNALYPFRMSLNHYFAMTGLPLLVGIVLGGMIDYWIPREYISKVLAAHKKRTIFYSVGLGFLMSTCSHGILALSMELHKKGASHASVISFLLASPWASLPVTFLLIGFFGWKAFLILGAAFLVAIITGLSFQMLEKIGWIPASPYTMKSPYGFSIREDLGRRMKAHAWSWKSISNDTRQIFKSMGSLLDMILFWILLGIALAALISAWVPEHWFHHFLGPTVPGLLMTMLFATILEVCSEGTAPLAFEIFQQTAAFGNVFAFLMGGVVTDFTEIALVWKHLGGQSALALILVTLPQIFLLGILFNILI